MLTRHVNILLLALISCMCACSSSVDDDILSEVDEVNISPYRDFVPDDTLRLLCIGNSFAYDAVREYLSPLLAREGVPCKIGCLYAQSATVDMHAVNASGNRAQYRYMLSVDGKLSYTDDVDIASTLLSMPWTYVSLQQESGKSGLYDTYKELLPRLITYVKNRTPLAVSIVWHQTWAYDETCTWSGFANYGCDQAAMYKAIMAASNRTILDHPIDLLVPCGTAVQNGRRAVADLQYTTDGAHLSNLLGCFIAASTWCEALTGHDVRTNSYVPSKLSGEYAAHAKRAAHAAVECPFETSAIGNPDNL